MSDNGCRKERRGFTLPELMIALCVLLLVTSTIVSVLSRQQRLYRGIAEILTLRTSLRDGVDILSADLRSASVQDTVRFASDTAVEFYSITGASVLCADPTADRMVLPPDTLLSGITLTAWAAPPDTGDYAVVYVDSSATTSVATWQRSRVASVSTVPAATACASDGAVPRIVDLPAGSRAYDIALTPAAPLVARRGAPVRFLRRVRYSVYRSGDGKWYLGYRRCSTGGCAAIQPVSGPYEGNGSAPLELRYFTSAGTRITTPTSTVQVARIDIVLRAASVDAVVVPGVTSRAIGVMHDSLVAVVAPRNGP